MDASRFVASLHTEGIEQSRELLAQSQAIADRLRDSVLAMVPDMPENCTLETPAERQYFLLRYRQTGLVVEELLKKNRLHQETIERKNAELLTCYHEQDRLKRRVLELEESAALHAAECASRREFDEQLRRQVSRRFGVEQPAEDPGEFLMQLTDAHLALAAVREDLQSRLGALSREMSSPSDSPPSSTKAVRPTAGEDPEWPPEESSRRRSQLIAASDVEQALSFDPPAPSLQRLERDMERIGPMDLLVPVFHQLVQLYGAYLRLRSLARKLWDRPLRLGARLSLAGSPRHLGAYAEGGGSFPQTPLNADIPM